MIALESELKAVPIEIEHSGSKLSIVLPAKNEATGLDHLLPALKAAIPVW